MITLTIKSADGSVYWVEHFNDQASADAWLKEEKTRKYWKASFIPEFAEILPPQPTPEEIAAKLTKELTRAAALAKIKSIDWSTVKTAADVIPIIRALIEKDG